MSIGSFVDHYQITKSHVPAKLITAIGADKLIKVGNSNNNNNQFKASIFLSLASTHHPGLCAKL